MDVMLIGYSSLNSITLPGRVEGSFTFDDAITKQPLLIIDAVNGEWVLHGLRNTKVSNIKGEQIDKYLLRVGECCVINSNNHNYLLYCQRKYDSGFKIYQVTANEQFSFGRSDNSSITYSFPYFKDLHFSLYMKEGNWYINTTPDNFVYVNGNLFTLNEGKLNFGDFIYSYGLKIYLVNGFLIFNNPQNRLKINTKSLNPIELKLSHYKYETVDEVDYYDADDYYYNTPRIRRNIEPYTLNILQPPNA